MRQFKFCYEKKEAAKMQEHGQGSCWRGVPLKVNEIVVARSKEDALALEDHPLFVEVTIKEASQKEDSRSK